MTAERKETIALTLLFFFFLFFFFNVCVRVCVFVCNDGDGIVMEWEQMIMSL